MVTRTHYVNGRTQRTVLHQPFTCPPSMFHSGRYLQHLPSLLCLLLYVSCTGLCNIIKEIKFTFFKNSVKLSCWGSFSDLIGIGNLNAYLANLNITKSIGFLPSVTGFSSHIQTAVTLSESASVASSSQLAVTWYILPTLCD